MLLQVLSNPWFYLLLVAAGWIGRLAIKHTVRAAVDHQFALRIEDHKHELQRLAEQERFDLQRRLAGASLYLQKQHAAAAEVYTAVRKAHGAVAQLFMPRTGFNLDGCSEADIRSLLSDHMVLEGKQEELLAIALANRGRGASAISAHIFEMRIPRALYEVQTARNLIIVNEIYFSDAADGALARFVGIADDLIHIAAGHPELCVGSPPPTRKDLDEAVGRVHAGLRAELADPPSSALTGARADKAADGGSES